MSVRRVKAAPQAMQTNSKAKQNKKLGKKKPDKIVPRLKGKLSLTSTLSCIPFPSHTHIYTHLPQSLWLNTHIRTHTHTRGRGRIRTNTVEGLKTSLWRRWATGDAVCDIPATARQAGCFAERTTFLSLRDQKYTVVSLPYTSDSQTADRESVVGSFCRL